MKLRTDKCHLWHSPELVRFGMRRVCERERKNKTKNNTWAMTVICPVRASRVMQTLCFLHSSHNFTCLMFKPPFPTVCLDPLRLHSGARIHTISEKISLGPSHGFPSIFSAFSNPARTFNQHLFDTQTGLYSGVHSDCLVPYYLVVTYFKYLSLSELLVHKSISIHILNVPPVEWKLLETGTWQNSV